MAASDYVPIFFRKPLALGGASTDEYTPLIPSRFVRHRDSYWHTSHMYRTALRQRKLRRAVSHLAWGTVEQILQGKQPVLKRQPAEEVGCLGKLH